MDYDDRDRPTRLTYPDGTCEETTYTRLDATDQRDRLGRWTHSFYDAVRRLVLTSDPMGRMIRQQWCVCGVLDKLIDANGNTTSWEGDAAGRLTKEIRADNSQTLARLFLSSSLLASSFSPAYRRCSFGKASFLRPSQSVTITHERLPIQIHRLVGDQRNSRWNQTRRRWAF